jgi:hypothetical protein
MTRKMTKFSRKRQAEGRTWNGAAWLNTLQRCTGYSTESLPGSWVPGTQDAAENAIKLVRDAFESIKAGQTPAHEEDYFDRIVHALGVACIRAGQIAGTEPADNIMLPPLIAGNMAMRAVLARRRKWRKWEMLAADAEAVDYALEIYETIVRASSPAQMSEAVDLRMKALKGKTLETLEIEHA